MAKPGRLYVPLDVNFADDPHVASLSKSARLLFIDMLCLCKRVMSDGVVTLAQAQRLDPEGTEGLVQELCDAGLLEATAEAESKHIVAWSQWNEESASVSERSKTKQEAGRKGGLISGAIRRERSRAEAEPKQNEAGASVLLEHRDRVETEKSKVKEEEASRAASQLAQFDQWYAVYPLHKAREAARRAFPKALARAGGLEPLLAGAQRYRADPRRKPDFTMFQPLVLKKSCSIVTFKGPCAHSPDIASWVVL